jgi:hypothetical protein
MVSWVSIVVESSLSELTVPHSVGWSCSKPRVAGSPIRPYAMCSDWPSSAALLCSASCRKQADAHTCNCRSDEQFSTVCMCVQPQQSAVRRMLSWRGGWFPLHGERTCSLHAWAADADSVQSVFGQSPEAFACCCRGGSPLIIGWKRVPQGASLCCLVTVGKKKKTHSDGVDR